MKPFILLAICLACGVLLSDAAAVPEGNRYEYSVSQSETENETEPNEIPVKVLYLNEDDQEDEVVVVVENNNNNPNNPTSRMVVSSDEAEEEAEVRELMDTSYTRWPRTFSNIGSWLGGFGWDAHQAGSSGEHIQYSGEHGNVGHGGHSHEHTTNSHTIPWANNRDSYYHLNKPPRAPHTTYHNGFYTGYFD